MKVVVVADGQTMDSMLDQRFGRAEYFIVVDTETDQFQAVDNQQNLNAAQGAGIQAGQTVANLGAETLITRNLGPKAFRALNAAGIKVFLSSQAITVRQALESMKSGDLTEADEANVQGHWS